MASQTNDNRAARLTCTGVSPTQFGRSIVVSFSRELSNGEIQFFREVCERTAPLMEDR